MDGEVVVTHTKVKHLLDMVRSACKGQSEPLAKLCKAFNAETEDGRVMDKYSCLLGDAIHSMIKVQEDGDIDSLFTRDYTTSGDVIKKTTALLGQISGLDDFELIAFLVVR